MSVEKILQPGRQQAPTPELRAETWASATFLVSNNFGEAHFSELGGISSEVEQAEYMEASKTGAPTFGRFLGKAKPPTVTLKRSMGEGDSSKMVWKWHAAARQMAGTAYTDTQLSLIPGGDPNAVRVYTLTNAIPTKVELAGIKAGGTEVVIQTLTMQCDEIVEL
jgi:phage tail-like protein